MVEQEIKKIVSDYTGLSVNKIDCNMDIQTELGLDSFSVISVVCDIEDKFGIEVPDEDFNKLRTLNDVISYIEQKQVNVA